MDRSRFSHVNPQDPEFFDTLSPSTRLIHGDESFSQTTDIAPPIHLSTTYRFPSNPDDLFAGYLGQMGEGEFIYSRVNRPTEPRVEALIGQVLTSKGESPVHSVLYSSGLSAFHSALLYYNPKRIAVGKCYHGCYSVIKLLTRNYGLERLDIDCDEELLQPGDLIHLETPINPTGEAIPIKHYADKAHRRGAFLLVDSTFAPPPLQDPFLFGADMVIHSATKYFGGHTDVLAGILGTRDPKIAKQLLSDRTAMGNVVGGMESWLLLRSLRTLEMRVKKQSKNATFLVNWLQGFVNQEEEWKEGVMKGVVSKVLHASLQSEDWIKDQMPNGFGPVFSLVLKTEDMARIFPSKLHLFTHATSLGGIDSLIEWRAMTDPHIQRNLLRVSCGGEDKKDLKEDLRRGLEAISKIQE
eukprot:TRINITY_DN138_c0_g1_i2.p1 TRINITY_DN138_c0_g1~~TRINITY_DN138_c0_g1_i2.p1  ORF type:complete len:411 (+),score=120.90 TRINITY_DN138_c0_g1_i2:128-1360(+)